MSKNKKKLVTLKNKQTNKPTMPKSETKTKPSFKSNKSKLKSKKAKQTPHFKQNSAVFAQIFVDFFDFFDNLGDYPLRRASPSAHTAMLFAREPLGL